MYRFFLLIALSFVLLHGSGTALGNISALLHTWLLEQTISQTQYEYIINFLEQETSCEEIQVILLESGLHRDKQSAFLEEICPVSNMEKDKRSGSLEVSTGMSRFPKNPGKNTPFGSILASWEKKTDFRLKWRNEEVLERRGRIGLNNNWQFSAGHLRIPGDLEFINGRRYYSGFLPRETIPILSSEYKGGNGASFHWLAKKSQFQIYGSWNPVWTPGGQPVNATEYGAKGSQELPFLSHSHHFILYVIEKESGQSDRYYLSGIRVREKLWRLLEVDGGMSWNETSRQFGYYQGLALASSKKLETHWRRASKQWTNPHMSSLFTNRDTLPSELIVWGRGENIWTSSTGFLLLEKESIVWKGKIHSEVHWADNGPIYDEKISIGIPFQFGYWDALAEWRALEFVSTPSHRIQTHLQGRTEKLNAKLEYTQPLDNNPWERRLALSMGNKLSRGMKISAKWQCKNIQDPWEDHTFSLWETWKLSKAWQFSSSLYFPWKKFKLDEGFRLQIQLKLES